MSLKLKTKAMLVWVKINENLKCEKVKEDYELKDGEAMALVEILSPKEEYNLFDSTREVEWEKTPSGQEQRVDKGLNWYEWKLMKIKKSFKQWKGFLDDNDLPIPCTDENKDLLFNCNKDYFDAMLDFVVNLEKKMRKNKEKEIKNLNNGQSGNSATE